MSPATRNDLNLLVDALVRSLHNEHEVLSAIGALCAAQVEALRANHLDRIEEQAMQMSDRLSVLNRMQRARERQVHVLGSVADMDDEPLTLNALIEHLGACHMNELAETLKQPLAQLKAKAQEVQRFQQEAHLALRYAADLNRSLIEGVYALPEGEGRGQTYTAGGQTAAAPERSIISTTG